MDLYDFEVNKIDGTPTKIQAFKGKVLLIVNTASNCGFTPQYDGLESLYERYKDSGLEILGFPCNQFGYQEKGSNDEIRSFCKVKFGIKFPMFEKIKVNGKNAHPLYSYLKEKAPGILGSKKIKWNFTKFLVSKNGEVIKRYAPNITPEKIEADIKEALDA